MNSSTGMLDEDVGSMYCTVESWSELSDFKDEQKTIEMLRNSFEKQEENSLFTLDSKTSLPEDWCSNSVNNLQLFTLRKDKDPPSSSIRKFDDSTCYDHQNYLVESMTGIFLSDSDSDNENKNANSKSGNQGGETENSTAENEGSTAKNECTGMDHEDSKCEKEKTESIKRSSPPGLYHDGRFPCPIAPFPFGRRRLSMPDTTELHQKVEREDGISRKASFQGLFWRPRPDSPGLISSSRGRGCRRVSLPEHYDMAKTSASFHAAVHAELFAGHPVPVVNYGYCKTTVGSLNMTVYSQDIPQLESFSRQHSSNTSCESLTSPLIEDSTESPVKYEWLGHPTEVSVGPVKRYVGVPYKVVPLVTSVTSVSTYKHRKNIGAEITGAWNPTPPKYPEINCENFLRPKRT